MIHTTFKMFMKCVSFGTQPAGCSQVAHCRHLNKRKRVKVVLNSCTLGSVFLLKCTSVKMYNFL